MCKRPRRDSERACAWNRCAVWRFGHLSLAFGNIWPLRIIERAALWVAQRLISDVELAHLRGALGASSIGVIFPGKPPVRLTNRLIVSVRPHAKQRIIVRFICHTLPASIAFQEYPICSHILLYVSTHTPGNSRCPATQ